MAINELASLFHTEFVPFFISNCIRFVPGGNQTHGSGNYLLVVIITSNYINTISVFLMIFIPWQKGPKCYLKWSPYFYLSMMLLVYFFIPFFNIVCQVSSLMGKKYIPQESWFEPYYAFYFVMCCCRIAEFFTVIRLRYFQDAKTWMSTSKYVSKMTENEI
jgi:hypothetical protein